MPTDGVEDDGEAPNAEVKQDSFTDKEQEEWRELMEKPQENLSDAEKTSKIKLSIKRRFDPLEWALAFELASPDQRRADAIAVNTFPSRNFKIVGFEFKASRSDWLSEKREGAKSDYFVTLCDEWYVVAWSGVVTEKELPEGWGLLELKPNSEQLWKQVESELTENQRGEPDRAFWGRFIQKTVGGESNYTQEDLKEARKRGYEDAKAEETQQRLGRDAEKLKDKAETVDKLAEAGLLSKFANPIDEERIERIKTAESFIRPIRSDNHNSLDGRIDRIEQSLQNSAERMAEDLEGMRDELQELEESIEGWSP